MATLGQQLKAAREAKGVSEHDAGTATKILTKIICAMEADDFSVMAAPTYAKGFIRLYAEYLGLEPEPLVDEYLRCYAPGASVRTDEDRQLNKSSKPIRTFSPGLNKLPDGLHPSAWLKAISQTFSRFPRLRPQAAGNILAKIPPVKDIRILAAGVAGLLVLIILSVSISNCARRHAAENPPIPNPTDTVRKLLDEPLPDLYLVEPGQIESTPRP
jgi:hypothetical protein